jgi:hypothetical protein
MANDLVVGDNVVVCESSTLDESFWLLICDKHVHCLKESFMDEWNKPSMKAIMSLEGYGMSNFDLEAELTNC